MSDSATLAPLHVVVGASGQIGAHVVRHLLESGARVRAVSRSRLDLERFSKPSQATSTSALRAGSDLHANSGAVRSSSAHPSLEALSGDIGNEAEATRLCAGASAVYACFGGPQTTWAAEFPRMARGLLSGAARAQARVLFADNLYAYGPQLGVLSEATAPNVSAGKPKLRAEIAELFLDVHRAGHVPVAIVRASDLYGPGVENALLNRAFVARILSGRTVFLPGKPRAPHAFTYAPDVARVLVRLAQSSTAWGEVWHVPSAPAVSPLEIVAQIAQLGYQRPRSWRVPSAALHVGAWFSPLLRELVEMSFQWDRPYLVSHSKLTTQFGLEPTSLATGLRMTVEWVKQQQRA